MNCTYHDSPLTTRRTPRKKIYISCSNGLSLDAKMQALKDFNAEKDNVNNFDTIRLFKRTIPGGVKAVDTRYDPGRETILLKQEWSDAAFNYMKYIL